MARYRSQAWKDKISLRKREKSAERRRKLLSLDQYEQRVEEEHAVEPPSRAAKIDFDELVDDAVEVTRLFASTTTGSRT